MKLTLTCKKCGKSETFEGRTITSILASVDAKEWGGRDDICPSCDRDEYISCDPE